MFDPGAKVLGDKDGGAEEETSPRNLVGTTLFDELRLGNPAAKVVAIALKGRGSLLLGGQTGTAYFFSDQSGSFTTTSYYAAEPPGWVKAWNGRKLADAAFGKKWERLLPAASYQGVDDSPSEDSVKGLGRTFPHPLTGGQSAPGELFFGAGFTLLGSAPLEGDIVVTTAFNVAPSVLFGSQTLVKIEQLDVADVGAGIVSLASSALPVTMTVTAVPEPESWLMMLAGVGLLGAVAHRRRTARA